MGVRRVIWKERAKRSHIQIAVWHRDHLSLTAAQHYLQGIEHTVSILAQMPTIGTVNLQLSTEKIQYYEFIAHPRYKITYRFTSRTLYIIGIRSTLMK